LEIGIYSVAVIGYGTGADFTILAKLTNRSRRRRRRRRSREEGMRGGAVGAKGGPN
jgi:hypothetical protein